MSTNQIDKFNLFYMWKHLFFLLPLICISHRFASAYLRFGRLTLETSSFLRKFLLDSIAQWIEATWNYFIFYHAFISFWYICKAVGNQKTLQYCKFRIAALSCSFSRVAIDPVDQESCIFIILTIAATKQVNCYLFAIYLLSFW